MLPEAVFAFVVEDLEGGDTVTDDPRDPGGLTKWGLSQRAFPSLDIAALTRDQAMALYYTHYWAKVRGDELPLPVALVAFDAAVNQGASTAVKLLQRAVGVGADGVLGPATLAAVRAHPVRSLIEAFMLERVRKYFAIDNPAFIRGWINRVVRVTSRAVGMAL